MFQKILHTLGFGPALYASFSNGLAYQYLPGEILTVKTCSNEKIYPKVAEKMAQFHLQYDNVKERLPTEERYSFGQSILWTKLMNFIKLCPEKYEVHLSVESRMLLLLVLLQVLFR